MPRAAFVVAASLLASCAAEMAPAPKITVSTKAPAGAMLDTRPPRQIADVVLPCCGVDVAKIRSALPRGHLFTIVASNTVIDATTRISMYSDNRSIVFIQDGQTVLWSIQHIPMTKQCYEAEIPTVMSSLRGCLEKQPVLSFFSWTSGGHRFKAEIDNDSLAAFGSYLRGLYLARVKT